MPGSSQRTHEHGNIPEATPDTSPRRNKSSPSPEVCTDVVANYEAGGEEEPEYAVENVVRDELDLGNDHADRHDRPRQLADLKGKHACVAGIDEDSGR